MRSQNGKGHGLGELLVGAGCTKPNAVTGLKAMTRRAPRPSLPASRTHHPDPGQVRRQVGERTKIGVHEFNDRPVSVHGLSKGFPNEMPFVDDLVGRTEFAKGLLSKLRDVVGGAGLRGSRRIWRNYGCERISGNFSRRCRRAPGSRSWTNKTPNASPSSPCPVPNFYL